MNKTFPLCVKDPVRVFLAFNRLKEGAIFLFFVGLFFLFQGCASVVHFQKQPQTSIEKNFFQIKKNTSVVGQIATIHIQQGDTLPDIARHYSLGINTVHSANPNIDIWVPEAGKPLLLPLSFILPKAKKEGIVINLPALRLFHFTQKDGLQKVATFPIGAGTVERPTPMGKMQIIRKKHLPTWHVPASIAADHLAKGDPLPATIPPGPLNPLGEYALYLSRSSYLIHGTNKPASVGLRASNGCIRLFPENIQQLFEITSVKTPVAIVNQPYLIGQRDGIVYLEAHRPFTDMGKTDLKKIYLRLSAIEKETGRALNWDRIDSVVENAQGVPVAVSSKSLIDKLIRRKPIQLRHPRKLYGKPLIPSLASHAWYILAGNTDDFVEARRLAAIINHQGPQIPARVIANNGTYRVLTGPFTNKEQAENTSKRLKIDLDITGIMVAP